MVVSYRCGIVPWQRLNMHGKVVWRDGLALFGRCSPVKWFQPCWCPNPQSSRGSFKFSLRWYPNPTGWVELCNPLCWRPNPTRQVIFLFISLIFLTMASEDRSLILFFPAIPMKLTLSPRDFSPTMTAIQIFRTRPQQNLSPFCFLIQCFFNLNLWDDTWLHKFDTLVIVWSFNDFLSTMIPINRKINSSKIYL